MDNDDNPLIASDNPLSEAQRLTLASLVDVIVPASEDGRMPSAGELDLVAFVREHAPESVPVLGEALDALDEVCASRDVRDFAALAWIERHALVEELSSTRGELFDALHAHTLSCYYTDDRVLKGLGLQPGPPFPRGNTIEAGDLSLLDPVARRAKLYRD